MTDPTGPGRTRARRAASGPGDTGGVRSDRILLAGMAFEGRHGVGEDERAAPQPFEVDLALELDLAPAGHADDLSRTVDYSLVFADVRAVVEGPSVLLLETLAERIATLLLDRHPAVVGLAVTVRKLRVPIPGRIGSAAVEIHRGRGRDDGDARVPPGARPPTSPAVPAAVAETLLALELALARRDEAAIPGGYEAVLDERFAEIGSSGRTWTRDAMLGELRAAGASDRPAVAIAGFAAEAVGAGLILVRYETVAETSGDDRPARARRSSLWVTDGRRWRMRFHQGTPLPGGRG